MNTRILAAATITALMMGFAPKAEAGSIWVKNSTKNAIWYTVYMTGFRTQGRASGCLTPGTEKQVSHNDFGRVTNVVYVLGEVKASTTSCANHSNKWEIGPTMLVVGTSGRAMITWNSGSTSQKPSVNNTAWH